jgi:hypothetical protein
MLQQQPTTVERGWQRPRLWIWMTALLLVFLALGALHGGVSASEESETIPPGGTVPPPPIDLIHGFIRVVHAAPFAPNVNDTAIDICDANNTPVPGLTGLTYLTQSGYLPFPPGAYDWYVGTPGCGQQLFDIPAFNLFRDAALTLLILGDGTNQPLTTVLTVDRGGLEQHFSLPLLLNGSILIGGSGQN